MSTAREYLRAIRGPVLLISLGILVIADHVGQLPFWRSWPVLLVVLGVMILLERSAIRPEGGPLS